MKTLKEWQEKKLTTIIITCRDYEGSLEKLLKHIQSAGNCGHSFSILVDPEGEGTKKHYWDGDGSDYIKDIKVS